MGWDYLSIPRLQQCSRWSMGMDKYFHPTLYWTCDYLSMQRFKFIHVCKRSPSQVYSHHLSSLHWYWGNDIEILSTWLALCEINPRDNPHKCSVMQNVDIFLVASLNKLLKNLFSCWWFEMSWCSLHWISLKCTLISEIPLQSLQLYLIKLDFHCIKITRK